MLYKPLSYSPTGGRSGEYQIIQTQLGVCVVGGGPAGISLLLAARRAGLLDELLGANLRIIERSGLIGPGEIGKYRIRSDSFADSFLRSAETDVQPPLGHLLTLTAGRQVAARRGQPVELSTVGDFLTEIANEVRRLLEAADEKPFLTGLVAIRAERQRDGSWATVCRRADGRLTEFSSRAIVLATGAHQPMDRLYTQRVAGAPLLPRFVHKTIQSSDFLSRAGPQKMAALLAHREFPKVAIVGGSHSALASAHVCLNGSGAYTFGPASITVLHRSQLRLTYASPAVALADGYTAFGPDDICAKTGRISPLAGFRCDSRDLLRRQWGLGGMQPDARLRLLRLEESHYREANAILQDADLIVAALGYRPRALPLFDAAKQPIRLLCERGVGPLVDGRSRVLNSAGDPVPGVFALGLSAGYPLAGVHGESNFTGQANGLALWQSEVGEDLVAQVLELNRSALPAAIPA